MRIPYSFYCDWSGAYEGMEWEAIAQADPRPGVEDLIWQLCANDFRKMGNGLAMNVRLTRDGLERLREEAVYRWEFNLPAYRNPYGNDWGDRAVCGMARRLADRCERLAGSLKG